MPTVPLENPFNPHCSINQAAASLTWPSGWANDTMSGNLSSKSSNLLRSTMGLEKKLPLFGVMAGSGSLDWRM